MKPVILVVEDDPYLRLALEWGLATNYEVLSAENGRVAMAQFEQHHEQIEAVITDIEMPEMNGFELMAWLERQGADVPIIVISDTVDQPDSIQLPQRPRQIWQPKPFSLTQIKAVLAQVLRLERR
jgi:DNA-binding response OmpR family regulator